MRLLHNIIIEKGSCIIKPVVLAAGFVILFWGQDIYAQPHDTVWTQFFGGNDVDIGYCVQQTTDGGYIITGYTTSYGAGSRDVYLIKTDSSGDSLWTQTFGGDDWDVGFSVQQTTDGGYIIAGVTASFGAGNFDVYLIKTDSSGDSLWTQTFGGSASEYGVSVQQTTDEGYIITGATASYGAGSRDVYLIKTDSSGDSLWTQTFGGSLFEWGSSVQQTTDGGYIITGYTFTYSAGMCDIYLIKTDSSGDTVWTQTFGGSSFTWGYSVQQTTDGGYIIAGATDSYGAGVNDVYLIKTNSSGDSLWTQTFGGCSSDIGRSVQQTTDGGYIIAGSTNSYSYVVENFDVYLIKLQPETGIEEENEGSEPPVALVQIDPNPFSSELSITYSIPEQTSVELTIFDLSGRLVEELISDQLPAGTHTVMWSPSESIPNGCYLIEFNACGRCTVGRCLKLE